MLQTACAITAGALMLCWPAFRNGFPIVFSDTGTYIDSYLGTVESLFLPHFDRPDWYGGVIALFSVQHQLWGVVLAQAWIGAWLIRELVRGVSVRRPLITTSIICALCAIATPLPLLVSTLMPDAWLSFGFLAAAALCVPGRTSVLRSLLLATVVLAAGMTGSSHAVILIGSLTAVVLSRLWMRFDVRRPLSVIAICVAALLVLSAGNWSAFNHFRPVEGAQIFLFARLVQDGSMDKVLPQYCAQRSDHPVCRNEKEILASHLGKVIVWSPLAQAIDGWQDKNGDLANLNRLVVHKELPSLFAKSARNSLRLFFEQSASSMQDFYRGPYDEESAQYAVIRRTYPLEARPYLKALQQSDELDTPLTSTWLGLCWISAFGSMAYALVVLVRGWLLKHEPSSAAILAVLALGGSMVNAIVSASLSGVVLRYEARTSAIVLPIMLACLAMQLNNRRKQDASVVTNLVLSEPEIRIFLAYEHS